MDRQKVLGRALYRLRKKADMNQNEASDNLGTTQATWARYEKGERAVILKEDTQAQLAEALGFRREDLLAEAEAVEAGEPMFDAPSKAPARTASLGFSAPATSGLSVDLQSLFDQNARVMQIVNEDVAPVFETGQVVVYSLGRPPKRNQPVVIKMRGGGYIVRIYTRTSASHIECYRYEGRSEDGLSVFVEKREYIPLMDQEGVYPILLRVEA
jgi:transcriptional regulator with XRE-family HTH domain